MTADLLARALAEARRALIDLSPRNRLLSLPEAARGSGAIGIVGEKSESLWRLLVTERKAMGFAAGIAEAPTAPGVTVEEETPKKRRRRKAAAPGATAAPADPDDLLLSTALSEAQLPKSLLRMEQAARSFIEEQGIPLLFLALGTLHWADPKMPSRIRRAPLLLVPVALARRTARDSFALRWNESEVEANETLAVLLSDQFRITLPQAPDFDERAEDGFAAVSAWMEGVGRAVADQPGWKVAPDDVALGLFGFAKLLMARDIEHPRIAASPWVGALLANAPPPPSPAEPLPTDADLDEEIRIERLDHVVDADASQTRAIERARRGDSLVIQGPPGTGKSQTITNIIAQAVLDGKTVLFVAEKMAALSVVKRRLDAVGLGAACLELHSDKASRAALLAELDRTLKAARPQKPDRRDLIERLGRLRGRLNRHARALHAPIGETGLSAYDAIGRLAQARIEAPALPEITLAAAEWTSSELADRRATVRLLRDVAAALGSPGQHPWRGVGVAAATADDAARLTALIPPLLRARAAARTAAAAVAQAMGVVAPDSPEAAAALLARAQAVRRFAAIRARAPGATDAAWTMPGLADARAAIAAGGGFFSSFSGSYRAAQATLVAAVPNAPADKAAQLALLDALIEGQSVLGRDTTLLGASDPGEPSVAALAQAMDALDAATTQFAEAAALEAGARAELASASFAAGADRLSAMAADPDGLAAWLGWARAASDSALAPLVDALASGQLTPDHASAAFDRAVALAVWKAACRKNPELATFDQAAHTQTATEFRTLDTARLDLARAEAAHAHAARQPDGPELAIVRGEIAKRRGHMPIRRLMTSAAGAIAALKPVLMMSPLSVAQYLDPDAMRFDLLVIDEASQIEPVDAIGAIARAQQIIVVGDDRQMPPTAFFKTMTSEDDEAPPPEMARAKDVESILSLCNARGVPTEMLRWHYRSRHQSLIKVSNDAFYEGRLLVIPSPRARTPELGLNLVRVEGGVFDTGGEGTNAVEARAIAEAAIAHARERPKDTLGIAAFSVSQRDAILDAVEALRRENPDTEAFFNGHEEEKFFVKNLENVQGDERDVIMISIGYAPDSSGSFAMRFGPLSADGGERRLNVLITRAKKRCTVFSSITADQIDLERAAGRGVVVLKDFLAYAAGSTAGSAADSAPEAADSFARAVQLALAREGIATRARVGLSGLFLDLAVAAPEGGDLALGIATDGPFYVLARGARDRDRQRDGALSMMGWKLARTWSPAWLLRPEAEACALADAARAATGMAAPAEEAAAPVSLPGLATAYVPAVIDVPKEVPIPKVPFTQLGDIVAGIVRAETPVHQDTVALRAAVLWDVEPDAEIRAAVQQALRLAREFHGLVEQGAFWSIADAPVSPRDRSALPAAMRRPALVAPAEWRAAILALLDASPGTPREQLEAGTPKLLGLGPEARAAAAAQLAVLEGEGSVVERGGGLFRA
jgi:hypothetical protein